MIKPDEKGRLYGFYRGVVEDNNDPLKAGRVRIRIYGLYDQKKTKSSTGGVPTDEIPWSEPCLPIMEGGHNKYGIFSVPVNDSHVMVFFENGDMMEPRYFASLPGKDHWEGKSGTYPENFVIAVHGGHYIELDSTPGASRIKINHKSGTNIEITEDGTKTDTIVSDTVVNITGDNDINITGNCTIDVSGTCDITSVGKCTVTGAVVEIDGGSDSVKGVITGDSICAYTGSPHFHTSGDVKASIG